MTKLRNSINALLVVAATLLVACAQVGAPQPENLQQSIAYGYSTLASVRATAASALTARTISVADAKVVQGLADQARAALDLAAAASKAGKPADAQSALVLATQVLTQLQAYMKAKGG